MELLPLAEKFGLPVVMLIAIVLIAKLWIASSERVQMERTKVEDKKADSDAKKADAMVTALTSLTGKVDQQINTAAQNHAADLQSHSELSEGLARVETKLDEAKWYREEKTNPGTFAPTRTKPNVSGERHPRRGTHHDGED